ncbi:hypothetical protein BJX61DRAFT_530896 [Aspergillus egyptiacus]|nr:hypothetical protein BJX61DRAFT_530896 [Aspergillus egyptiacus]
MAGSCLFRSTSIGAITVSHFIDVLQRTWLEALQYRQGTVPVLPRRLGLAVSGGADSMALAYLCKQWEEYHSRRDIDNAQDRSDISVTAFVVDHKARQESTQEANTVANWLRELGIKTRILPLTWPGEISSITAFETHARQLRFQALGKACRDERIGALLTGHHQDDNVETTIWRLASGARGAGLAGISAVARIPECHGLFGVSESGEGISVSAKDLINPDPYRSSGLEDEDGEIADRYRDRDEVQVSVGGILIARPLLSFAKSSLVATCHENGVPFVSDPTNFDPTLTPRNAIRSLLANGSLPRALQKESILSLIGSSRGLIRESHFLSDQILKRQCRLLGISFRTGCMTIQFKASCAPETESEASIRPDRLNQLLSMTLRRITELMSPFPENTYPLRSFIDFTQRVFPAESPEPASGESKGKELQERKAFTLGSVLFKPVTQPGIHMQNNNNPEDHTWLLTRQPFMRDRSPLLYLDLPPQIQTEQEPRNRTSSTDRNLEQGEEHLYSPWALWDNRFWIRAALTPHPQPPFTVGDHTPADTDAEAKYKYENTQSHPKNIKLLIRALHPNDIATVRKTQRQRRKGTRISSKPNTADEADAFFAKLSSEAPGNSRFTVPVLAIVEGQGLGKGEETGQAVALPTMDLWFPYLHLQEERHPWTIRWEWKYKMIDLEALRLMGSV